MNLKPRQQGDSVRQVLYRASAEDVTSCPQCCEQENYVQITHGRF